MMNFYDARSQLHFASKIANEDMQGLCVYENGAYGLLQLVRQAIKCFYIDGKDTLVVEGIKGTCMETLLNSTKYFRENDKGCTGGYIAVGITLDLDYACFNLEGWHDFFDFWQGTGEFRRKFAHADSSFDVKLKDAIKKDVYDYMNSIEQVG